MTTAVRWATVSPASWLAVPLELGGGAYFQVTGSPDVNFTGNHSQVGAYYVQFDLFKADGSFFKTLPLKFESVEPNTIDNVWFNPPAVFEPERVGGTVTVTLQNIVGPGSGDSVDFFQFSGLLPNQQFSASLAANGFSPLLGQFGNANNVLQSMGGANPVLTGVADGQGKVLLAVTGAGDTQFIGQHIGVGTYSLVLSPMPVPEPQSLVLAAVGAALAGWMARRRGSRLTSREFCFGGSGAAGAWVLNSSGSDGVSTADPARARRDRPTAQRLRRAAAGWWAAEPAHS